MASDPAILFVKPKAVSVRDKKALSAVGVIVVEVEDPQSVKLERAMRMPSELDAGALLNAAAKAIRDRGGISSDTREAFANAVCEAIKLEYEPEANRIANTPRNEP